MKNNQTQWRTVRFEQEAPNTSPSSTTHLSLQCLASERRVLLELVLVKNAGHVDDILRDGRESCITVLDSYREHAGDLKSELSE